MIIIKTTFPNSPKEVKQFCFSLIGSNLVKCINKINYVKSYFKWEGKIQSKNEVILLIKCKKENLDKVKKMIESKHPYKVPEIVCLEPKEVNKIYLDWINE